MRKLIMWNVITLDGFFEGDSPWDLHFHQYVWGKELEEFSLNQLKTADALVFGSSTYLGMADYWTNAGPEEGEISKIMNRIQKIVCSKTLQSASWNHTSILKDPISEIPIWKEKGYGNMFVFGSGSLSDSLRKANLFDEYRLCVAPLFLGKGKPLFLEENSQNLKLLDSKILPNGGVILYYSPQ
jgi:dihydrofolate reductase